MRSAQLSDDLDKEQTLLVRFTAMVYETRHGPTTIGLHTAPPAERICIAMSKTIRLQLMHPILHQCTHWTYHNTKQTNSLPCTNEWSFLAWSRLCSLLKQTENTTVLVYFIKILKAFAIVHRVTNLSLSISDPKRQTLLVFSSETVTSFIIHTLNRTFRMFSFISTEVLISF